MTSLLVDGRSVAPVEVADTARRRTRGLLGRDGLEGALWLEPANGVHTIGMRFAIDVAVADRAGRVLRVVTVPPGRLTRPVWRGRITIETSAGDCRRWGLVPGVTVALAAGEGDPAR